VEQVLSFGCTSSSASALAHGGPNDRVDVAEAGNSCARCRIGVGKYAVFDQKSAKNVYQEHF
jgi:hypothetical protein